METNFKSKQLQFVAGNAMQPPPEYYQVEHEILRQRYGNRNTAEINSMIDSDMEKYKKRSLCIFISLAAFILAYAIPTIILLDRGGRFETDYHKYKDLPATTCLGGANITDIWYSPPYPFNTTLTYTPAWATYKTYGYLSNGSLVPVLGQIPNKLEKMGYIDRPCGNCDDPSQHVCSSRSCSCSCKYRLGDLQIVIARLQSLNNFTCVIDTTDTIFSLVPSADKLNYMYRNQQSGIITLSVCTSIVVLAIGISYWSLC